MNHKMILSYDGTAYFGWQKTKTGPSIQEALEKALSLILRVPVSTEAASRTDRGVHAKGQVINFFLSSPIPPSRLVFSLNSVLPPDIRVLSIEPTSEHFHPTLDATSKEYRYFICNAPVQAPPHRLYSWHIHVPLDVPAMRKAALHLVGTHDFASFTTIAAPDTIRTILDIQIIDLPNSRLEIRITGDRFLYKMVRRLVGTLIAIGKHKLSETQVPFLLTHPNRSKAGPTAAAHGLTLYHIHYRAPL